MPNSYLEQTMNPDSCSLEIRLKPRAKNDRVSYAVSDDLFDIAVTSPPIDDRANAHLVKLLADRLGVGKSAVVLIKGGHSRSKVVAVSGVSKEEAVALLS